MAALTDLSIAGALDGLARKQFSSQELTEAHVRAVEAARADRRATSLEETIEGVAGIAAPLFDGTGDLLAGLVIGAPTSRALSRIEMLEDRVSDAAAEISRLMGYRQAGIR